MWPLPCSHTLSQPRLCSRGDLPIAFRGTVIFSATFPSLTASPLSFVAVLTRYSCPIVPMMQSTLPNNYAQASLSASLRYLAEVSHHFFILGTTSPSCKRLPRWLCVAVKFGVCVCECGKVTALKHLPFTDLPSVPRCRDFNRFFIASMVFRTAPSCTCTTLRLCLHHLLLHFCLSF